MLGRIEYLVCPLRRLTFVYVSVSTGEGSDLVKFGGIMPFDNVLTAGCSFTTKSLNLRHKI